MDSNFTVDGSTLTATGEIDISCGAAFQSALDAAISAAGTEPVTIRMSGVSFIDSSGLRVLLGAQSSGRQIIIGQPSAAVSRLLEITATDALFTIQ